MIKLNIRNMKNFLETVNQCENAVIMLCPDGKRKDINKHYGVQSQLMKAYRDNKDSLELSLDMTNPRDYLRIVYYYIGECG